MTARRPLAAVLAAAGAGALLATAHRAHGDGRFLVQRLVSDRSDPVLVNAWGLAATATGPWWVANEGRGTSTLYAGDGRKQALTLAVPCGPTGIAALDGGGFVVHEGAASGPARFVYACEDGTIRAWSPSVPHGWSTSTVVAVDARAAGAVFRGVAVGGGRLYATDFHNDRVLVFDRSWRRLERTAAFADPRIPKWYSPFDVRVLGGRVFVTYASPAPVDGNDAPTGGYVDEFDLDGRLQARVAPGRLDEPWGLALAPPGFGRFGGDLVVASFGSGHVDAYARTAAGWRFDGRVATVPGVWGIAFGNGHLAGPRTTLYYAAGPHRWRGASELDVHGALGAVRPPR